MKTYITIKDSKGEPILQINLVDGVISDLKGCYESNIQNAPDGNGLVYELTTSEN